jgi:phage-related protein
VGTRCQELRVRDVGADWRIVCRVDPDAIVILEVFSKKTRATPRSVIETCIRRLREYDGA